MGGLGPLDMAQLMVTIDDKLHGELKEAAWERRMSLRALCERFLRAGMATVALIPRETLGVTGKGGRKPKKA